MSCNCNQVPCVCAPFLTCCEALPARNTSPPSPLPPWSREYKTGLGQALQAAGAVSLTVAETYLEALLAANPDPIAITIPDGSYQGQKKQIYLAGDVALTAVFTLTGTFKGFTSLTFDGTAFSALLNWDGAAWQFVGGTAQQIL